MKSKLRLSEEILLGLTRLDHFPGGGGTGAPPGAQGTGCVMQLAQAAVGKVKFTASPSALKAAIHKRHSWTKDAKVRCPHHHGCSPSYRKNGANLVEVLIHMNDVHKDDARMIAYLVKRLEARKLDGVSGKTATKLLEAPKQPIPVMTIPQRQKVKVGK